MASSMLPPPAAQNTLRSRQIAALRRMLNLNVPISRNTVAIAPVWKILVYDKYGSDIISPLLSVKELRSLGVTLHLLIDGEREQISDAAAVYFVMPSAENIERICNDLKAQLYDNYYFNFISPIPRDMLEKIANTAVACNCVSQISKLFDQYLNFLSLEEDLFVTRHQNSRQLSYCALNRADAKDTDIESICDTIVASLFSVFVTAGAIPIIRCPKGNAAEMIAEKLDKKIRDNLRDPRNSLFTGDNMPMAQLSFTRPLLVILDRSLDLATPLHHTWTYQALSHDVLDLQLNRVTIPSAEPEAPSLHREPEKTYDLLPGDKFWVRHRGSPFPEVADAVQKELEEYKKMEAEVMKLKDVMGENGDDPDMAASADFTDHTAKLSSAISSLPELMDRKKKIDMHTNIATALLDQIKERKLDTFFETEDKMITKSSMDKSVLDLISDPSAGTPEDKMRLFVIYYILSPDLSESDLSQHQTALEAVGADTTPLNYLKQWKAFTKMASNPRAQSLTGGTLGSNSASTSSMSTMFSHLMSTGSKYMEGVKNLVVGTKNLPVTRVVEQLLEAKSSRVTDDYRYFDPKMLRVTDSSNVPRSKGPFQEAFVFVVGGGNYIEYQNLQDYCKRQQNLKTITYGSSQLMNARDFLSQMLPAAYMPSENEVVPPRDRGEESGGGSGELEPDQLCPNCGQALPITEIAQTLLSDLIEKIRLKKEHLAALKEEVASAKLSCRESVELKGRLAEQWNAVLLARSRVRLTKSAYEAEKKATKKELEEVQLLEKANRRRTERLKQVSGKDFSQKEHTLLSEITEDQKRAAEKLNEVVEVRRRFLTELYTQVFPIEVLPLSVEDEGAEDYYDQTSIDCDRVLELDSGWVLGGVHQHPTPHISIVAPSLPASGDHTPYLSALQDRLKNKGAVPEKSVHPTSDPYLSTPAALVFVAQFVEVIGWVLDQPLPFPLHRPVAISEYGIPVKSKRSFLEAMAKLDDNIMYLCFSQHVPLSAVSPGHTLQNLLALITHSQLGRTGSFECDGALACYDGSLYKKRRRHKNSSRGSPLLLSHDMDDSQPPKVSYASTHSLSSNSDEESTEDEGDEMGVAIPTPTESMMTSQYLDWEHLDPSIEDLRLFEEDQMRQALRNPAKRSSTTSPEQQRAACIQAQEAEIYRQRLRRLDYNSTYMDYAALTSTGSSGIGGSNSAGSPLGPLATAGDSFKSSASGEEKHGQQVGKKGATGTSEQTAQSASVASGIFGTLSSLWTSTFGGSKS